LEYCQTANASGPEEAKAAVGTTFRLEACVPNPFCETSSPGGSVQLDPPLPLYEASISKVLVFTCSGHATYTFVPSLETTPKGAPVVALSPVSEPLNDIGVLQLEPLFELVKMYTCDLFPPGVVWRAIHIELPYALTAGPQEPARVPLASFTV
jgi:hypothetical protein